MGAIEDAVGNIFNRTKDTLSYKAGDVAASTVIGGVSKGVGKITGAKETVKKLVKCPKCGAKLEPDAKFCPECGYKLIVVCAKCNVEYPVGTKFCKQCGEALK
ncbi:MAG: zinc ribbon domain-containing protein [Candidatus Micrarchaeia archaeon]|jgi:ribosomal protein L40E